LDKTFKAIKIAAANTQPSFPGPIMQTSTPVSNEQVASPPPNVNKGIAGNAGPSSINPDTGMGGKGLPQGFTSQVGGGKGGRGALALQSGPSKLVKPKKLGSLMPLVGVVKDTAEGLINPFAPPPPTHVKKLKPPNNGFFSGLAHHATQQLLDNNVVTQRPNDPLNFNGGAQV
jgi:hypothetical protein